MGQEVQFSDLAEVQPEIHSSLTKLLEHEGDVEDFGLFFQVQPSTRSLEAVWILCLG